MKKWSVDLSKFHIEYEPRTAIKGQVLANFIAEFTGNEVEPNSYLPASTGGQDTGMLVAEQIEPVQHYDSSNS